jgi:hypothetical protein
VAIIACPRCQKEINVPEKKLGRWIVCPVCTMEFAALADASKQEDESEEIVEREEEVPRRRSIFASRWTIPVGLLILVAIVGISAYAIARHASKNSTAASSVTISHEAMPPLGGQANDDSPFAILSQLQQGSGGAESILGIGSTIKSFIYWTTVISVVFLVSSIGMLIWMARDSRNRGMESVATWIMPILLTNILAFLVYWFSRPKGQLANCRHCNNRCLENALTCPHCRRPKPTRKKRSRDDEIA